MNIPKRVYIFLSIVGLICLVYAGFILLPAKTLAQQSAYARYVYPIYSGPGTPCRPEGSIYYHMLDHKFLICKNTGVEEVGSGGSGTIPDANGSTKGLLVPADWNTFNGKQNALGFTPENIANKGSSNGYADLVGGKIPLARISEVLASTDLTDYSTTSGSGSTAIHSTISSAATNDVLTWNGTNWVNQAPFVISVFGRNGIVTAQSGDYTAAQVTNAFNLLVANNMTTVSAPASPSVGFISIWADGTDKILKVKDNTGSVSITVKPNTCTGTDKVSSITSAGVVVCTADQTGSGGTGITTLNTLVATTQTFATVNDTNVTLNIGSVTSTHTFTLGWTGTLAKSRQNPTTVYTDQTNTFGAFVQTFQAGSNFKLVDPTVLSKAATFNLSNITAASTRLVNIPDADSTTVQPSAASATRFANAISAQGVVNYAQPNFTDIAGIATDAQVPDVHTATKLSNLINNGFVKTSGSDGTLSVDTSTYLTANQTITLTGNVTGTGATTISTTIANNSVNGAMIALGSDAQGDIMYYNGTDYVRLPAGTAGQFLQTGGAGANPSWITAAGTGDMILAGVQTVTGAKTFSAGKLIIGTNAGAPTVVANSFYIDSTDGKFYLGARDGSAWHEIFEAGVSVLNVASGITGILPVANGGTSFATYTKGDLLVASGSGTLVKLGVGTNGNCLKADSTQTSGLIYGTCAGGGSGDFVGPGSATDNAIVRFDGTTGKLGQNSGVTIDDSANMSTAGSLNVGVGGSAAGFLELTQGTAPSLGTTSVILYAPTSVTSYAIKYPAAAATGIPHFTNASNIITMAISAVDLASADVTGFIPVGNVVHGTITNSKCLHVDGTGVISETGADCGAGGGGANPAGSATEIQYRIDGTTFGAISNSAYNSTTGVVTFNQLADTNNLIYGKRFTNTTPTGNFLLFQNSTAASDLFKLDVTGNITAAGNITLTGTATAGFIELGQGTAPSLGTTAVQFVAPSSVTSYQIIYPSAAATGIGHYQNSSNVVTMSVSAIDLASADVTNTLTVNKGGTGVATITGLIKGNGTSAFSAAVAGTDYVSPSSTETLTNKTVDAEATGNLFTSPKRIWMTAAGCNATNASAGFDLPTSSAPTVSCTGTTTTVGALDYVDASTTGASTNIKLPTTWTGNIDINLLWFANAASSNAVRWQVSTGCVADTETVNTGPSFNTASAANTSYTGTANQRKTTSFTNVAKTNCSADETMWIKVERVGGDAADTLTATAELLGMEVIIRTAE